MYQVNDGEKDILIAIDEEYGGNFQVTFNQASGKYYQFFEMHTNGSPGQSLPGSSNSGSAIRVRRLIVFMIVTLMQAEAMT